MKAWIADVDTRLKQPVALDFDLSEVEAFTKICQHQAESLDDGVIENLADATIVMNFMNSKLEKPLVNMNDQWNSKKQT